MLNEAKDIKKPQYSNTSVVVVSKSPMSLVEYHHKRADDEAIYDVSTDFLNGLRSLIEGAETSFGMDL